MPLKVSYRHSKLKKNIMYPTDGFQSCKVSGEFADDPSCLIWVEDAGVSKLEKGMGGRAFTFEVLDFSREPWPLALTLKFLHLSYIDGKLLKKLNRENSSITNLKFSSVNVNTFIKEEKIKREIVKQFPRMRTKGKIKLF